MVQSRGSAARPQQGDQVAAASRKIGGRDVLVGECLFLDPELGRVRLSARSNLRCDWRARIARSQLVAPWFRRLRPLPGPCIRYGSMAPLGVPGPVLGSSDRGLCSDYVNSTSRLAPARSSRTSLRICSISAVRIPCVVRAARIRANPSAVRGPVLSPPCRRHRPFFIAGDRHGVPALVCAPHLGEA